jgi:hypothetical protein
MRRDEPARAVGLAVAGRRPETRRLDLRRVAQVVVERAVLLARDDDVPDRRLNRMDAARMDRGRPERPAGERDARGGGALQERPATEFDSGP